MLTAIISHSKPSTSRKNMNFTLCSIHILFNSNEFHEFWMSFDSRNRCTKNEQKRAKTQADPPLLGRPAWHLHKHCHVFDPGAMSCTQVPLSLGLDGSLIEWIKRLVQGSVQRHVQVSNPPPWKITSIHLQHRCNGGPRRARGRPVGRP